MPPQAVSLRRATTRPLSLALLGPFRARLGDGRPLRIRRGKARALLAYLAMRPAEPQPREKLMALLGRHEEGIKLVARAEALGMRPLAARCQATLGELWERSGNLELARRARAAAAELRHELGLKTGAEAAAARG